MHRTIAIANSMQVKVLHSPAGRARQMNCGAEAADGIFYIPTVQNNAGALGVSCSVNVATQLSFITQR